MERLIKIAADLLNFCEARSWRACVIGGLAVQRWGEPRLTRDVDLSLLTGFGHEERFIDSLTQRYQARIPGAKAFALRNRVLLLAKDGVGIDVSLAAIPFEERVIERSSWFEFLPAVNVKTCSAEDLIVYKAFADRPRDWVDIEGVLIRQGSALDLERIEIELRPLVAAKEAPGILTRLKHMFHSA
jgi:Nucleotidyl transferase AbiEii toxin, Type IV TA system